MINKYGTKIDIVLQEKVFDCTIVVVYAPLKNIMEYRKGNSESENSTDYVSFRGGPFIREGQSLKDLKEELPNKRIESITYNHLFNIFIIVANATNRA